MLLRQAYLFFTGCVISSDLDMCVGIYFLLMIGLHVQIKLLFSYISGSQCFTSPHNRLFASIILVITLNPRFTKLWQYDCHSRPFRQIPIVSKIFKI